LKNSCLGVFLVFLFIIFFSATVVLFVEQFTFLNPNFYKKQFEKADFYNKGSELIVDLYETQEGGVAQIDPVAQKAFSAAIEKTITPAFLKEETEKALIGAGRFLNLKTKIPEVSFDMEKIRPDFEKNLYDEIIKEQEMSWEEYQSLIYNEIEPDVNQIFKKYSLDEEVQKDPLGVEQNLGQSQTALKITRIVRYLSLGITILLLALIIFLSRQNLQAVLRWSGWGVGISGLVLIILSLIFGPVLGFVRDQLFAGFSQFKETGSIVIDLVNQIFDASAGVLLWTSVIIFVIGLGMIVASFIVKGSSGSSSSVQRKQKSSVSSAIAAARK